MNEDLEARLRDDLPRLATDDYGRLTSGTGPE